MIGFFLASRAISMSVLKAIVVSQERGLSRYRRDSVEFGISNVLFRLLPMQNRQQWFPIGKIERAAEIFRLQNKYFISSRITAIRRRQHRRLIQRQSRPRLNAVFSLFFLPAF
jgi:hypothetical protein